MGDEMKWAVSSGAPRVGSRTKNRKGEAAGITEELNSPLWPDVLLPAFSRGPSHLAQKKACSLLAAKAPRVGITPRQGLLATGKQHDRTPGGRQEHRRRLTQEGRTSGVV